MWPMFTSQNSENILYIYPTTLSRLQIGHIPTKGLKVACCEYDYQSIQVNWSFLPMHFYNDVNYHCKKSELFFINELLINCNLFH